MTKLVVIAIAMKIRGKKRRESLKQCFSFLCCCRRRGFSITLLSLVSFLLLSITLPFCVSSAFLLLTHPYFTLPPKKSIARAVYNFNLSLCCLVSHFLLPHSLFSSSLYLRSTLPSRLYTHSRFCFFPSLVLFVGNQQDLIIRILSSFYLFSSLILLLS